MKNGLSIDEVNAIYTLSEKCPFRTSNQSKLNLIYESALQHNLKTYSLYCKILMITVIYQKRFIHILRFEAYSLSAVKMKNVLSVSNIPKWLFTEFVFLVDSILMSDCKCSTKL